MYEVVSDKVCQAGFKKECHPPRLTLWRKARIALNRQCGKVDEQISSRVLQEQCSESREECRDVESTACQDVPRQGCTIVPNVYCKDVPREECSVVPRKECATVPGTEYKDVTEDVFEYKPQEVCHDETKPVTTYKKEKECKTVNIQTCVSKKVLSKPSY